MRAKEGKRKDDEMIWETVFSQSHKKSPNVFFVINRQLCFSLEEVFRESRFFFFDRELS